jgi:dihydrofolate synthase/folylpolyglutamate synthase
MDYGEATDYIFNLKKSGSRLGLERARYLLNRLGNPHEKFRIIHVGGTNGKGSVVAMIASMLKEAGFRTGAYTSPHLCSFTERAAVNGIQVPEQDVVRLISEMKPIVEEMNGLKDEAMRHPTFFEVSTAMFLKWFAEQKADFAVLEVGLGGRLDATNVVDPLVSVITNVSMEHAHILGNTLTDIAGEKAGIIKPGKPLVTATEKEEVYRVLRRRCEELGSKMYLVGEDVTFFGVNQDFCIRGIHSTYEGLSIPLLGGFQMRNAAMAVAAVELLRDSNITVGETAIRKGLENVEWPGRMELMQENPQVVIDAGHNPGAIEQVMRDLKRNFEYDRLILVLSFSSDKDYPKMLSEMVPFANEVVFARHKVMERGVDPAVLAAEAKKYLKPVTVVDDVKAAVKKALGMAGKGDLIFIGGSVFTAGEAREFWKPMATVAFGRQLNEDAAKR